MKFIKLLKDLRIDEEWSIDRYELLVKDQELKIRGGNSLVAITLDKWIHQENGVLNAKQKQKALQILCSKLLNKNIDPDFDSIKRILETVFDIINDIPDFSIKINSDTGVLEDVIINDTQEYNAAISKANFRQFVASI